LPYRVENKYLSNAAAPKKRTRRMRIETRPMPSIVHAIAPSVISRIMASSPQVSLWLLIRRLFPTTLTLEIAIAPAAIIGLSRPNAASGMAAML
jgi:hypothetical protein